MVSSFREAKSRSLADDLKKEPLRRECTSCKMSFHGILAALSKTFFWKKTCTRCSDSSAITGTKKDQRGSWSSSWGVVCSRTLIADVHGLGSG